MLSACHHCASTGKAFSAGPSNGLWARDRQIFVIGAPSALERVKQTHQIFSEFPVLMDDWNVRRRTGDRLLVIVQHAIVQFTNCTSGLYLLALASCDTTR